MLSFIHQQRNKFDQYFSQKNYQFMNDDQIFYISYGCPVRSYDINEVICFAVGLIYQQYNNTFVYYQQLLINMDAADNILDHNLNIELYLNLGADSPHADLHPIYEADEIGYIGHQSCIQQSQILLWKDGPRCKPPASTTISDVGSTSQKKSAKQATAKYRERRKMHQQQLQAKVRSLEQQIQKTDAEIKSVKDAVLNKLQSNIKLVNGTQNAEIYTQLQTCIPEEGEDEALADIDKINLLLNTLKFRIGPTGRERQAKIEYNFKNIINTLFPGLHRYFLLSATQKKDLFGEGENSQIGWTKQLMNKLNFSEQQVGKIKQYEIQLKQMYQGTLKKINRLQAIKKKMKQEAINLDGAGDEIREHISPVQCASFTLFCEKHKYRKDISLDQKFKPKNAGSSIQSEMQELLQYKLGRKRVHRDPQSLKV